MSIVTRGLSAPDALLSTFGLGIGSSVIVVCPVEQVTDVVEAFEAVGIAERELSVTALDPAGLIVVVEYGFDSVVLTPIQRSSVIDRLVTIQASQPELDVSVSEVAQTAELVELFQVALTTSPELSVRIIEIAEDVDVQEAIDKVQS